MNRCFEYSNQTAIYQNRLLGFHFGLIEQIHITRSARWPERGVRYLATRFSAKEAFSKAIGLGMRMPMTWRLCEIANLPSGAPVVVLHGGLKTWFEAKGLQAQVTLSDETDYAVSFCIVEAP